MTRPMLPTPHSLYHRVTTCLMTSQETSPTDWQNRIVRYGVQAADQFTANPRNPRRHPQTQRDAVKGSLDTLGFIAPVIVNRQSGFLIDGHERVMQALGQGDETPVPFIEVDLSEDEEALALASFDWITYMATYDQDVLTDLLKDIDTDNAALQALLDDIAAQNNITLDDAPALEDQGADIDRGAELAQRYGTALGQIWQLGKHRLAIGDSTDKSVIAALMEGGRADICFTSPPYNVAANSSLPNKDKYQNDSDERSSNDYLVFLLDFIRIAMAHSDYVFVNIQSVSGNKIALIELLYELRSIYADTLIWDKCASEPAMAPNVLNSRYEYIHVFSQKANRAIGAKPFRGTIENLIQISSRQGKEYSDIHKATYPTEFAQFFVENFSQSSVFDPFLGSGTTLIACEQTGRVCYGVELDPTYAAVVIQRWETMTGQTATLLTPRRETHEIEF